MEKYAGMGFDDDQKFDIMSETIEIKCRMDLKRVKELGFK